MFSNLRFEVKIWLLLAIAIISSLFIQVFDRINERDNLLESRKSEVKHLVENASSLLSSFYERRDILGEAEAKKQAVNAIRHLRYDNGSGYFWINDYSAKMVMHPIKPALNGKDLSEFTDPKGTQLFSDFVKVVRSSESGYVDYYWAKPGKDEPVAKTSYVQGFKPWNYIIGSGVYIDDIDELFWKKSRSSIFLLLATLIVVAVIARMMTQDLVEPLKRIVSVMKDAANGDFRQEIEQTERRDELGGLSRSFISMQSAFRSLINHCKHGSEEMSSSATVINDITSRTSEGVDQQHSETELLASAIEELAMTIQEIANNAAETSDLTHEANTQINQGNEMMRNTIGAISSVSDDMTQASQVISQLEADVQQIDTILGVIRNISEQTNLLALNAAIEAARAGETGRGFAVVADEVRSLAQRTHESTEEIQAMTEALQSAAANAVKVMEAGKIHTQSCVDNAYSTGECLMIAGSKVAEVTDRNNMIAATVEQQGIVANEVSSNVVSIKEVAHETHEGATTLSQHSEELQKLTSSTQQLLEQYKV
ncbi:hypothetical protein A3740_05330 [Oleiphilus sp. HI0068]|uniref:methyl-accepting chemotaxis protein n=5 Tax=Oleiphilus TaxID=141450 RepID=UPI0007C2E731|nr:MULTISPECIES: methyl-accepting chemotaxis protein [unclassified Oleiphilus]KZY80425.1 hypothetical protein A3741_18795 [Oleiphilus sp. HI0069]KZY83450.1 hypothetical protein A3740_05330 [Oleiphilus sp. HI0068]KZY96398.1 hypothetical protein A3743_00480 [Oleiphilus sp. HI0072]KZY30056.1 hypothetical protein A3729_11320 [Oleiphilus sp. HI0043]KZY52587.1 hypothetical protein A3735_06030 [Oleiphilus sp. HI0061]